MFSCIAISIRIIKGVLLMQVLSLLIYCLFTRFSQIFMSSARKFLISLFFARVFACQRPLKVFPRKIKELTKLALCFHNKMIASNGVSRSTARWASTILYPLFCSSQAIVAIGNVWLRPRKHDVFLAQTPSLLLTLYDVLRYTVAP